MKKIKKYFLVMGLLLVFMQAAKATEAPLASVRDATMSWCKSILNNNTPAIVDYYAANAVLLPTLNKHIFNGQSEITKYFKDLVNVSTHPNLHCRLGRPVSKEKSEQTIEKIPAIHLYGNQMATSTGFYTFYWDNHGTKAACPARFIFVYQRVHNQWRIVNHHSSLIPPQKFERCPFPYL